MEMGVVPHKLLAWFGPAIGPEALEAGEDVRAAFMAHDAKAAEAYKSHGIQGKYHADIYLLARHRLNALGISRIHGGNFCTFHQKEKFFSYRRDGVTVTGRMVGWSDTLIKNALASFASAFLVFGNSSNPPIQQIIFIESNLTPCVVPY